MLCPGRDNRYDGPVIGRELERRIEVIMGDESPESPEAWPDRDAVVREELVWTSHVVA
jgi:hypothetical protein